MSRLPWFAVVSVSLAGLAFAACGDSASDNDDPATTGTSGSTTGTGATSTTSAASGSGTGSTSSGTVEFCEPPEGVLSPRKDVPVDSVSGVVLDTAGAPVVGQLAQLCGKDICINGMTGAGGTVTIMNSQDKQDRPVFKAGDGLTYCRSAYEVNLDGQMVDATVVAMTDSAAKFDAGATLTAAGAQLELDAMGTVGFIMEFGDETKHTFRAGEVPAAEIDNLAANLEFDAMWGLGPIETAICPAAKLTVPNTNAIPAGTVLDVYYQELSTFESYATYGTWAVVAEAEVSADGTTISTTDGNHLPILGLIGFKAK